jgi:tetratricopeptide (TPR) repeat protein
MKMICHKELIWVFAILATAGCAANIPSQPPPAAPVEQRAYQGPENQYYYFTAAEVQRSKGNLDKAIVLLRKAIELDSESFYLQRELATVYIQNKEDEKALEVLAELLQKDPNDVKSLIIFGGIKQVRKESKEAIAAYEKILTLDSKHQRIYSLLGSLYMEAGELERAKDVYNQQIENFPGSYTAHFFLGKIHARQNNVKDAEKEFQKALELRPERHEPLFELIILYKTQGKTEKVIALLENILKQDPNNVRASMELAYYYYRKGKKKDAEKMLVTLGRRSQDEFEVIVVVIQLYVDQKKYDEALIIIDGLLKGRPGSPDLNHLGGVARYELKKYDQAIVHFEKVTPESRFFQDAVVHVAFIYQDQGKRGAAVTFLTSAIEKDPDNPDFKYYLGTFYEELKDYENAALHINQAIAIEPDNPRYYFRLGVVYDKWDQKEASMEAMRTVISLDPKHANAMNYLGYTYADLGLNLDEAERLVKKALTYKPNDGYITDSLGWVYYKKGEFDEALKYLKKAIELVPDDPIMLEHLGDAYLKLDDKPNALRFYQKSLKLKDKDTEALQEKIRQLKGNGT